MEFCGHLIVRSGTARQTWTSTHNVDVVLETRPARLFFEIKLVKFIHECQILVQDMQIKQGTLSAMMVYQSTQANR